MVLLYFSYAFFILSLWSLLPYLSRLSLRSTAGKYAATLSPCDALARVLPAAFHLRVRTIGYFLVFFNDHRSVSWPSPAVVREWDVTVLPTFDFCIFEAACGRVCITLENKIGSVFVFILSLFDDFCPKFLYLFSVYNSSINSC